MYSSRFLSSIAYILLDVQVSYSEAIGIEYQNSMINLNSNILTYISTRIGGILVHGDLER